jgi:hypothetical protein
VQAIIPQIQGDYLQAAQLLTESISISIRNY